MQKCISVFHSSLEEIVLAIFDHVGKNTFLRTAPVSPVQAEVHFAA